MQGLAGWDFGNVAEAIDQVIKDKLTHPMLGLRMVMDSLELRSAFGTTIWVGLNGYPFQSGGFGERDARPVLANGIDGQVLKLMLCHLSENLLKIFAESGAAQFIIIV